MKPLIFNEPNHISDQKRIGVFTAVNSDRFDTFHNFAHSRTLTIVISSRQNEHEQECAENIARQALIGASKLAHTKAMLRCRLKRTTPR